MAGSSFNPDIDIIKEETNDEIKQSSEDPSFNRRRPTFEKLTMGEQPSTRIRLQTLICWNVMLIVRNIKNLSLQTVLPLIALVIYFYATNGNVDSVDLSAGEKKCFF